MQQGSAAKPGSLRNAFLRYGCAVGSVALAIYCRLLLDPAIGDDSPFLTLFLAIGATAAYGGFAPGLFAVLVGAIATDYLLLRPRGTFGLEGWDLIVGMLLYLLTGLGLAWLGEAMRAARIRAETIGGEVARQAALIDQTYDAILSWDWNGPINYWNNGAERLYGFSREEAIHRVSHDLLGTQTVNRTPPFLKALEKDGYWEGELQHTTRDGRNIVVESRIVLIHEGTRGFVVEANRDITRRKEAEAALRDSQARVWGIIDSAMDAMISIQEDQSIVLFNSAAEKMFRCSSARAMGQSIEQFLPERFRNQHKQHVEGFGKTGVTSRSMRSLGTLSGLRSNGEEFPIEASISQLEESGHKLYTVILRDITERRRAEEDLRKSQAQLQTIVENLDQGVALVDLSGKFVHMNRAAVLLHDFESPEAWNRPRTEFTEIFELSRLDGTVLPPDQWPLSHILRGEAVRNLEVQVRRFQSDWHKIFSYGGTLVHDSEGHPLMAMLTIADITERERAAEEIRGMNADLEVRVKERTAQLEAANKELEAFSYSVSHDLRAPLRAVDGFSQALMEDYGATLPPEGQQYLKTIRVSAQRMGELIDDLLAFSRLGRQQVKKRPVDTAALVQEVLQELAASREERNLELKIADLPPCYGDRSLVKQVWVNLLSNAFKYTRRREPAVVEIGCSGNGEGDAIYYVRDNGTGFDMKYAHKLFGVFERLHVSDQYEGTGVGLAIAQRVIQRHGGHIWAEAALDKGATFFFSLPGESKE